MKRARAEGAGGGERVWMPVLALVLLMPAPSLGGAAGMWWWPDEPLGKGVYALSKVWMIGFPLWWFRWVEKGRWRVPRVTREGVRDGLVSGVLLGVGVWVGMAFAVDRWFSPGEAVEHLRGVGLDRLGFFVLMGVYWSTVNAAMEEMVWRWFVLRQVRELVRGKVWAAVLGALAFSVHHWVVILAWLPPGWALMATGAVFCAGLLWNGLTMRHGSVVAAMISHLLADAALVGVGVWMFLEA